MFNFVVQRTGRHKLPMSEMPRERPLDLRVHGEAQVCLPAVPNEGDGQAPETGRREEETRTAVRFADHSLWPEGLVLTSGIFFFFVFSKQESLVFHNVRRDISWNIMNTSI